MNLLWQTLSQNENALVQAIGQHIIMVMIALVCSALIAMPLGIILARHKRAAGPVIGMVSVVQTIPSLALLGFLIPLFGIGIVPALIALTLYALLPILRNTYTGITGVDPALLEAGHGMGMTKRQILFMVELPVARHVIMAGVRTAAVWTIGTATLATFIGAGGLGDIIMRGIDMIDTPMILLGAIPAALLALVFDGLLLFVEHVLTPRGLRITNKPIKEHAKRKGEVSIDLSQTAKFEA